MHLEAMIKRVRIFTRRAGLNGPRDALGGRNRASLEMHFEDAIEQVWRCTWRP